MGRARAVPKDPGRGAVLPAILRAAARAGRGCKAFRPCRAPAGGAGRGSGNRWYARLTMAGGEDGRVSSYLIVTMGGERCAIPADRVLKVLRRVKVNTFPGKEAAFIGLARYGSDAVAVLDGASLFGIRGAVELPVSEAVVVMVRGGPGELEEPFGLLVEDARRIVGMEAGEDGALPDGLVVCDPAELGSAARGG